MPYAVSNQQALFQKSDQYVLYAMLSPPFILSVTK